ncbi:MAG: hypothetical protein AUK35_00175 [Zetaproteobacteria bacterium CG2_30_46_52]|nr:MAG: hypothetical protein AUK35_00175 [Zetaproteobacteria bacterium CG2_30_46_52]
MPSLTVKESEVTTTYPVSTAVSIGRHPDSNIVLHDKAISKRHAVVRRIGSGFVFEDLDSSNGSFYNEMRFKNRTLRDGDTIKVGQVFITFHDAELKDDVSQLVNFEQFDTQAREYKERVDIDDGKAFHRESEFKDSNALRVDYEKLRMGHELLQSVGVERNLTTLLNVISKKLIEMFSADRCVILLINRNGEFVAKSVQSSSALTSPVNVSTTVLKEVRDSKSAVLLADANEDELGQQASIVLMGVQSVMCSPILLEGRVIGAVHLDMRQGQGMFAKKDLQLLGGIVAYISMAVANASLEKKIKKEVKMQAQFERLLSPSIVEQLISGKLTIAKGGELRQVTIMFADIRGFTQMSQKSSPVAVLNMLNQYFERVVSIIFKYGGTVDKFVGDEVMALFGAPIAMRRPEDAALACAMEIQSMLTEWNQERVAEHKKLIPVGIGINTGEVIVGAMGSSQTMQYTCIGNAVNVASRLTGLAKAGQVLVSKATLSQVKSKVKYTALPPTEVKGIDAKLECFVIDEMEQFLNTDTIGER